MHVRGLRMAVALATVMTSILAVSWRAPAALADPSCPKPAPQHAFAGWTWNPASGDYVNGVRAPIRLRRDGLLCILQQGELEGAFNASWIGIGNPNGGFTALVQIGFIHDLNAQGNPEWCRFWFNPSQSTSKNYYCGDDDNQQVYFEVQTYVTGGLQTFYGIYDCGIAGNFDNCNLKNGDTPLFTNDQAIVYSETDYDCTTYMQGQGTDRVWYGNSSWATSINDSNGWSKNRNWTDGSTAGCSSDYMDENDGGGLLRTWDSRNTG